MIKNLTKRHFPMRLSLEMCIYGITKLAGVHVFICLAVSVWGMRVQEVEREVLTRLCHDAILCIIREHRCARSSVTGPDLVS